TRFSRDWSSDVCSSDLGPSDVAGYRLYRSLNGAPFTKVEASVPTGEDPKFVNFISASQSYRYYVTAVDVAGKESNPSPMVSPDGDRKSTRLNSSHVKIS